MIGGVLFDMIDELPFESHLIRGDDGDKDIFIGSPFYGYPKLIEGEVVSRVNSVLLDSNIFVDVCKGRNVKGVRKLFEFACAHNLSISPLYAMVETSLNYHSPRHALNEFRKKLREDYGIEYPEENADALLKISSDSCGSIKENVFLIRSYLVIVKKIFSMPGGLKKHIDNLIGYVRYNDLPQFGFLMILSVVLLFARKNQELFDSLMIKKIDKDMQVKTTREKEELSLDNVARDIALFLACCEGLYSSIDQVNEVFWIASSDATLRLMLEEICVYKYFMQPGNGLAPFSIDVGLRKGGRAFEEIADLLSKEMRNLRSQPSRSISDIHQRKVNLRIASESIMNRYRWDVS